MKRICRAILLVLKIWRPLNVYQQKRCDNPYKYDPFDCIDLRTAISVAKIVWK